MLSKRVEIDDAYLGGELPGGKVGRDTDAHQEIVSVPVI